jgi:ribonuclease HI
MELMAVKELLLATGQEALLVQADSQYVINVFTKWLPGWRSRGMRTSSRKPVENQDLVTEIDRLLTERDIQWEWVRGHAGHPLNERADALARHAAERSKALSLSGSLPPTESDPPRLSERRRS